MINEKFSYIISIIPFILTACKTNNPHEKPTNSFATIVFAGDTMLGRLVNKVIQGKGYKYVWGNTIPLLNQADLRIINLETTLTKSTNKVPKVFNFKSDPQHVASLKEANISVVSLANNHIKDFGNEGLVETIKTLQDANIKYIGAGKDEQQARSPLIVRKNNLVLGILGATDNEPDWIATKDNPGTNYFHVDQIDQLLADIKRLKQEVDIVIVSLHWGPNMRERPSQPYIDAAHAMIDAGADIIQGHSAHIFQGIEIYQEKLILYDTGDFVDDYQVDPKLRNDWSFLFFVTVAKNKIESVKLVPIKISNMQVNIAKEPEKSEILHRMQKLSQEFNTHINNYGIVQLK